MSLPLTCPNGTGGQTEIRNLMQASSPLKNKLFSNETCMSLPLTCPNGTGGQAGMRKAHASFIAIKKQITLNENLY